MAILGILLTVFLFGMMIFVHELGHYLVARWVGMEVRAFSIGFGKAIWSRTVGGIEYRLGILPFGGYVMLPQMYAGVLEGHEEYKDVEPAPPVKRILVALAGGFFNILFALVLACIINVVGTAPDPGQENAVLGFVDRESPAYEFGLRLGDEIVAVRELPNGEMRPVESFNRFQERCFFAKDGVEVEVRGSNDTVRTVRLDTEFYEGAGVYLVPGLEAGNLIRVGEVMSDSPAEKAGVRSEDVVTHVEGIELRSWAHMVDLVRARTNVATRITVLRPDGADGHEETLTMTPLMNYTRRKVGDAKEDLYLVIDGEPQAVPRIGITSHTVPKDFRATYHPPIIKQVTDAASHVFMVLKRMMTPSSSKQAFGAVSGPVGIIRVIYVLRENPIHALAITLLISVNLAIINLLPFPVLDGGHILFALYRLVVGRDPPPRIMVAITNVFVLLIITLLIFVTFRDVLRIFHKPEPPAGVEWVTEEDLRKLPGFNPDYL